MFDLWLAVEVAGIAPEDIAGCFQPYRPEGWTAELALANLEAKAIDRQFASDIDLLAERLPPGYTLAAGARVVRRVLEAIDAM